MFDTRSAKTDPKGIKAMAGDVKTESTLLKLAERVEAATGPDQALDRDIQRTVAPDDLMRHYTASIDAAMTLVPEGMFPLLDWSGVHCRLRARHAGQLRDVTGAHALAMTPALALTAACLKARASTGDNQ